jgi:hypothetical protein
LSKADAIVVEDAAPRADDTVRSTVLFALGLKTGTVLAAVAAAVPPGVHKGSGVARLCERAGRRAR